MSLPNGFAVAARRVYEQDNGARECSYCHKQDDAMAFATPDCCIDCIERYTEDKAREMRNYRAKLRNCKRWSEQALALRGGHEPTSDEMQQLWVLLAQIAHEAIPHTEAALEVDEGWTRR